MHYSIQYVKIAYEKQQLLNENNSNNLSQLISNLRSSSIFAVVVVAFNFVLI
jgi:hypothetical protein